jgi:hypothetical protein
LARFPRGRRAGAAMARRHRRGAPRRLSGEASARRSHRGRVRRLDGWADSQTSDVWKSAQRTCDASAACPPAAGIPRCRCGRRVASSGELFTTTRHAHASPVSWPTQRRAARRARTPRLPRAPSIECEVRHVCHGERPTRSPASAKRDTAPPGRPGHIPSVRSPPTPARKQAPERNAAAGRRHDRRDRPDRSARRYQRERVTRPRRATRPRATPPTPRGRSPARTS